jgi:DNA polymerase-3 subunit gamma/tau
MAELYNKHRPKDFKRMTGNARNIAILEKVVSKQPEDRPHTFLFTGNTGCGKTTLGIILAKELGCTGDNLEEYNSASFRGIDSVRDIQQKMQRMPTAGSKCRVFLLEEAHRFTKDAQEALLKPTENCPKHVYFIFTTTNPEAMIPALKGGRVMSIPVDTLTEDELVVIMQRSLKLEKEECSEAILQGIAKQSLGSARNAISILEKVIALPEKERKNWKEVVQDTETMAIDLCRALMKRPSFKEIVPILRNMKEDAETVRRAVLGYANAVFLGGNYEAYNIIDSFDRNYYDTGKAGLSKSCYDYLAGTDPIKSAK